MNTAPSTDEFPHALTEKPMLSILQLVRRIHMFSGLFLAPWMVMYALSTLVMAHREFVYSFYPSKQPAMFTEREFDYSRSFPTNSTRDQIAEVILQDLGLSGTYY